MEIHVVDSLAEPVGFLWRELQEKYTRSERLFYVASPLSSTPLPIYQWILAHASKFQNWDRVRFILMDELVRKQKSKFEYIPITDPANYEKFAKEKLLNPLQKRNPEFNPVVLKPDLMSLQNFNPPIDLLILALGINGNYANVMPGTSITIDWYITRLLDEFKHVHTQKGSKSYEGANFTDFGMSLGPQQVLKAKHIIVIASGNHKKDLVKELLSYKAFDKQFPLSIIYNQKVKDRVQIFLTKDTQ